MSFETDLATFMAATRRQESGSFQGNYEAMGVPVYGVPGIPDGNRAIGAYQIMASNWLNWAAQAGISGASWTDPTAQDHVARYMMTKYYEQFGSWELVSVAWYGGPGAAQRVFDAYGYTATLSQIQSTLGSDIGGYSSSVMGHAFDAPDSEWGIMVGLVPIGSEPGPLTGPTDIGSPPPGTTEGLQGPQTINFVLEGSGEEVEQAAEEPNPRGSAVMRALITEMADHVAGGRRMSIEEIRTQRASPQVVTEDDEQVKNVSPEEVSSGTD